MAVVFVTRDELRSRLASNSDPMILDVRSQADYDVSSLKIRGAARVPPGKVQLISQELPRDREIIVYCSAQEKVGVRITRELHAQGFDRVYPLAGGFEDWLSAGFELEPK